MAFKILSWNVNGLRSFKQPMVEFLTQLDADIICIQETKITSKFNIYYLYNLYKSIYPF